MKRSYFGASAPVALIGAAAALLFLAGPTQAQVKSPVPTRSKSSDDSDKRGRIKINFGYPQESASKKTLGAPVLGFAAGYDLVPNGGSGSSVVSAVSLEYSSKSHTKDAKRIDLRYFGLVTEARYFLGGEKRSAKESLSGLYGGGGAGIYFLRYKRQELGVTQDETNGIKFGYKFLAGLQLKNGLYIEADYTSPGKSDAALINLGIGFRIASGVGG